jgi:hypothetical protein
MVQDNDAVELIGQMIDQENGVSTKFFLELRETFGGKAKIRYLIARSSDGRPENVTEVPKTWSDEDLLRLVSGLIPPQADPSASDGKIGCLGLDEDVFE